ncbi:unnamed protein product [Larinioides sclopetarius]|uniref:Uncharacterized protein n=1 Tax=Larinioides sclopetarius TaxID=280406 RepID=A0AAV2ARX7_9ARAC
METHVGYNTYDVREDELVLAWNAYRFGILIILPTPNIDFLKDMQVSAVNFHFRFPPCFPLVIRASSTIFFIMLCHWIVFLALVMMSVTLVICHHHDDRDEIMDMITAGVVALLLQKKN